MRNSDPSDTGGVDEPGRGEKLVAISAKTSILGVLGVNVDFTFLVQKNRLDE